jgi:hypothetical protein
MGILSLAIGGDESELDELEHDCRVGSSVSGESGEHRQEGTCRAATSNDVGVDNGNDGVVTAGSAWAGSTFVGFV